MMEARTSAALPVYAHDPVYAKLDQFFSCYFARRDEAAVLALLPDHFLSVGTGADEVADGREAFAKLLREELIALPDPIFYTISDYIQRQRGCGCWDCFCSLDLQITIPNGTQVLYRIRLTAGLHREGEEYVIDVLHASEGSCYQENGEFFPLKFLSQGSRQVNWETQHELMGIVSQVMPGGIVGGYIEEGFPLYVANDKLLEMAGYGSYRDFEEDIGGLILNSIHPEDWALVNREMARISQPGDQYELQYRMRRKDGSYFWVYDIGRRTVAADGRAAIISVLIDVSQQVYTQNCLLHEAEKDPLTGTYNRRAGQERILKAMQVSAGYLFFMLDLDNFKQVNDIYGHEQGDQALCSFAELMIQSLRKSDTICRLGGDEFAVFIADCQDIQAISLKFQGLIRAYEEMMARYWPAARSTLSAGGIYSDVPLSFTEIYQKADKVLYEIKKSGKGQLKIVRL